jgi:hypothetical protein
VTICIKSPRPPFAATPSIDTENPKGFSPGEGFAAALQVVRPAGLDEAEQNYS